MLAHSSAFHPALRILIVMDQPVLVQYIMLALNHGIGQGQVAHHIEEAQGAITAWRPHLVILDMDLAHGASLSQLGYIAPSTERLPVIALTRRDDLQTKLTAFDQGV